MHLQGTELSFLLFTCIFKGLNRASFYFYASSSSSSSFDSLPISSLDGNLSFHSSLGPLLFTTSFEFSLLQTGMLLLNESNIFPRRVFSLKKIMSLSPFYFHAFSRDWIGLPFNLMHLKGTELGFLLFPCIFKGLNRASFYIHASSRNWIGLPSIFMHLPLPLPLFTLFLSVLLMEIFLFILRLDLCFSQRHLNFLSYKLECLS